MAAVFTEIPLASASERLVALAGVGAVGVGSAFVWYFDPAKAAFFPACPLHSITGFACPGCGLTRGFHALYNGDLLAALGYNALIPLFGLIFGYLLISMLLVAVRGRGFPKWAFGPVPLFGFLILLIVFGILRNLPFYPFSLMYP